MRLLGLGLSCLLLALLCTPTMAQSDSKTAEASIVFDVRMSKITNSPLGKSLELKDKLDQLPTGDGPDMSKLVRVFGAATAPKDMEELQAMQQGGDLPIEFFVRFQFSDSDGAKSMLKQAIDKNGGTVERNGKTYYKAPDESNAPEGVMMYSPNDKTVEIGSEGFIFRNNAKPFTKGLNAAWGKVSDDAVRLAIDLESAKQLVDQMVSQAEEQAGNPMVGEMMGVFKKMKNMSVTMDLNRKNLFTVMSEGKSDEAAEEIKEAMDSLLFLAKQGGKQQAKQLEGVSPDGSKALVALVEGLNAQKKGGSVTVNIPRPEGFEKAVTGVVSQFGGMFGMGMNNDF